MVRTQQRRRRRVKMMRSGQTNRQTDLAVQMETKPHGSAWGHNPASTGLTYKFSSSILPALLQLWSCRGMSGVRRDL